MKLNIHLDQTFYLLEKTWKYGGSMFGTEVGGVTCVIRIIIRRFDNLLLAYRIRISVVSTHERYFFLTYHCMQD